MAEDDGRQKLTSYLFRLRHTRGWGQTNVSEGSEVYTPHWEWRLDEYNREWNKCKKTYKDYTLHFTKPTILFLW